jgi:hypothetical protein
VKGCLDSPYPCDSTSTFFIYLDCCDKTIITPTPISTLSFDYSNVALTGSYTFIDWVDSFGTCGSFTYSATLSDGTSSLPALITFDPASKTFYVD